MWLEISDSITYNSHNDRGKSTDEKFFPRAEMVRSKFLHSFYLLDQIQEKQRGMPKYCNYYVLGQISFLV